MTSKTINVLSTSSSSWPSRNDAPGGLSQFLAPDPEGADQSVAAFSRLSRKQSHRQHPPIGLFFSLPSQKRQVIPRAAYRERCCSLTSHLAPEWLILFTRRLPEGNASCLTPPSPTRQHIGNYTLGAHIQYKEPCCWGHDRLRRGGNLNIINDYQGISCNFNLNQCF